MTYDPFDRSVDKYNAIYSNVEAKVEKQDEVSNQVKNTLDKLDVKWVRTYESQEISIEDAKLMKNDLENQYKNLVELRRNENVLDKKLLSPLNSLIDEFDYATQEVDTLIYTQWNSRDVLQSKIQQLSQTYNNLLQKLELFIDQYNRSLENGE